MASWQRCFGTSWPICRAGDVDRARLARTVWGVFFVFVAPALTISIAAQGGAAWTAMGLRLLVLLVLVHLTYLSLLRAREHEADLLADAPRSRPVPGSGTPALAAVPAGQSPATAEYRSFLPTASCWHIPPRPSGSPPWAGPS